MFIEVLLYAKSNEEGILDLDFRSELCVHYIERLEDSSRPVFNWSNIDMGTHIPHADREAGRNHFHQRPPVARL